MALTGTSASHEKLASYQCCIQRIQACWPMFLQKRLQRLKQQERLGVASEKVAEHIVEDLLTEVLVVCQGKIDKWTMALQRNEWLIAMKNHSSNLG
jgi:hypothetical protein